jgi:hypothetical protein
MTVAAINPDLLAERYRIANLWAAWRMRSGEMFFQALAGLVFLAFALWLTDPWWSSLLDPRALWAQAWVALALGVTALLAVLVHAQRAHHELARSQRDDWLATLPIAAPVRAHARQRQVVLRLLIFTLLAISALCWARWRSAESAAELSLALSLGLTFGALMALFWPQGADAPGAIAAKRNVQRATLPVPDNVAGLRLLGAALEPVAARLPKTAAWVAGSFLLFPQSTPLIAVLALLALFTVLSLAVDLIGHWRARYLLDLQWLAAEALQPRRLFAAYLPWLVRRGLLLSLITGCCVYALGAPPVFAFALAAVLLATLADALLCGFATRKLPARYPILLTLHAVILLATTQVLPPALPLVWMACGWSAWRKGNA